MRSFMLFMENLPKFKNPNLLNQALTHRSYFNENPSEGEDNERLEFLGDAVLKFIMANFLYQRYPKMTEGELSKLRAALENNRDQLANFAKKFKLDQAIKLGKGAQLEGNRDNLDLLGDVFEAFIGAYFLDSGIAQVTNFIEPLLLPIADNLSQESLSSINFKGQLQEWTLANLGIKPEYIILEETGFDHNKTFTAQVTINEQIKAIATGKSKKLAQTHAAEIALKLIENQKGLK